VIWTAAIAVFVDPDLRRRFMWIPVSLGFAGLMSSIFLLALPANVLLGANVITLVAFVISFEVLKMKQHSLLVLTRQRRK
jgi:hypothetical protein